MKSALVLDQGANPKNAPEYLRPSLKPVFKGGKLVDWIYPKGTVFEGQQAVNLVITGQAAPIDEECAAACGMSTEELRIRQRERLAAEAGIMSDNEMQLFMAEVIDGVDRKNPKHTDQTPVYKPGRLWAAYAEEMEKQKEKKAGDLE